ncbi:unnamed protein product [Orchesella dallaii]|uniref:Uncharacterized protein n=1 Tax=Orchesella dallaii TaxID=48710 RepID=A0ABP1Q4M0_9HEXA
MDDLSRRNCLSIDQQFSLTMDWCSTFQTCLKCLAADCIWQDAKCVSMPNIGKSFLRPGPDVVLCPEEPCECDWEYGWIAGAICSGVAGGILAVAIVGLIWWQRKKLSF